MWFRLFLVPLLLLTAPAVAGVKEKIEALSSSGLVLVMDTDGNELVAQNADEPFVAASVTKIVTAWLALEVLGGDYRFETRFYLNSDRMLYVRGGGDPFLISEELTLLARRLVAAVGNQNWADMLRGMSAAAFKHPKATIPLSASFGCSTSRACMSSGLRTSIAKSGRTFNSRRGGPDPALLVLNERHGMALFNPSGVRKSRR
jgi:hypothetical protein